MSTNYISTILKHYECRYYNNDSIHFNEYYYLPICDISSCHKNIDIYVHTYSSSICKLPKNMRMPMRGTIIQKKEIILFHFYF